MDSIILSTAYLAPIEYYSKLYKYKQVFLETKENYIKQTYRNRCFIGSANDRQSLSIPIESSGGMKRNIRDIRVSDHANWRHQHWYAIRSTYNSSPFFEFYEDDFAPFFNKKYEFLFDFNYELMVMISDLIGIKDNIILTEDYIEPSRDMETGLLLNNDILIDDKKVADYRYSIHPKRDHKLSDKEFIDIEYYQLFSQKWGFRPNLSIVDLLFNMGPESLLILKDSSI